MKRYFQLKKTVALAVALVAISLAGCEKFVIESTEIDPNDPLYFNTDILPIIEKNSCTNCHGGSIAPDLRAANAYASLISGGYITVSKPESSKLYKQVTTNSSHIPKTTADEKKYILYWITQGAKEKKQ